MCCATVWACGLVLGAALLHSAGVAEARPSFMGPRGGQGRLTCMGMRTPQRLLCLGLRGGGVPSGVVPGFNIKTGNWSYVNEKTGEAHNEREEDDEDDHDGAIEERDLELHQKVVTVDQLLSFAADEAKQGSFDCAADLLLVAMEEVEDEFGPDSPNCAEVYLRLAQNLAALADQHWHQGAIGANETSLKEPQYEDEVKGTPKAPRPFPAAWDYAIRARDSFLKAEKNPRLDLLADTYTILSGMASQVYAAAELNMPADELRPLAEINKVQAESTRRAAIMQRTGTGGSKEGHEGAPA